MDMQVSYNGHSHILHFSPGESLRNIAATLLEPYRDPPWYWWPWEAGPCVTRKEASTRKTWGKYGEYHDLIHGIAQNIMEYHGISWNLMESIVVLGRFIRKKKKKSSFNHERFKFAIKQWGVVLGYIYGRIRDKVFTCMKPQLIH